MPRKKDVIPTQLLINENEYWIDILEHIKEASTLKHRNKNKIINNFVLDVIDAIIDSHQKRIKELSINQK